MNILAEETIAKPLSLSLSLSISMSMSTLKLVRLLKRDHQLWQFSRIEREEQVQTVKNKKK